jgi:hypothetical protein
MLWAGTIPGPVAMGRLFDSNCAYWRRGCGNTTENCLVYDNRNGMDLSSYACADRTELN